jgi:hypothetical protein
MVSDADAGIGGLNCVAGACPGIVGSCAGGYHYGIAAGQCCPACIPDSTDDCAQGQRNYLDFRQTQSGYYDDCKTDSDCVLVYESNQCVGCGMLAVNAAHEARVASALSQYANNNCATCPPLPPLLCPRLDVACVSGVCATVVSTD